MGEIFQVLRYTFPYKGSALALGIKGRGAALGAGRAIWQGWGQQWRCPWGAPGALHIPVCRGGPRRAGLADSRPAGAGERCGGRPGLILGFLPLGAMGNFHLALPPRAGTARFLWLARCCDLS